MAFVKNFLNKIRKDRLRSEASQFANPEVQNLRQKKLKTSLNFFWRNSGHAPLWFRMLSLSLLWTIFVLVLAGFFLSLAFRTAMEDNFDNRLVSLMDNLIRIGTSDMQNVGEISGAMADSRFEVPYSGWYWQISKKGSDEPLVRSASLWDEALKPDFMTLAIKPRFINVRGPEDQDLKVIERDIHLAAVDLTFRFSVAVDRTTINQEISGFNRILFIYLSLLGVGLLMFSGLQVVFGLRPLGKIRVFLAKIRNGTETHMPNNLPSEIKPLVDELNAMIDHNREIVERSRTQVGNLAHALKTPLAILLNEAALDRRNRSENLSGQVEKQTDIMHRQVDYYLRRARMTASSNVISSRCDIYSVIEDLMRAMRLIAREKKFIFERNDVSSELIFRGERQDLEEMVGNILENASKWAASEIQISCFKQDHMIHIVIADDGVGIDPSVRDSVFSRGERLDETMPGTGLGLSIVKDLVGLYGGEIILSNNNKHNKNNGLSVELILPSV